MQRWIKKRPSKPDPEFNLDSYQPIPTKYQLRYSILEKIKNGGDPLPDIDGREETKRDVIRAVLSGASPYLVSREGTGKTRLAVSLAKLLPPVPKIKGCPYNDDPMWPKDWLCPRCGEVQNPAEEYGIEFISGETRYSRIQGNEYTNEAKILGLKDIQAIAKGESPTDPKVFMGTGVLRGNRGVVCVDELPAIPTKVQVLFHPLLEENKLILEEYNWERPIDICFIATGNPEGFAHVNKIPEPLLDRLELIHMDMPSESVEKEIMSKERFKVDLDYYRESYQPYSQKRPFQPDFHLLDREVAVPWWIADTVNKTVRYTRNCPNIDKGASIRGPIKAIDHAYATSEMRSGHVASLKDACEGLKLALRGRIKLRPDLIGFGEKSEESFKKIDEVIEDVMWYAIKEVAGHIYQIVKCDKEKLGDEIKSLLSGGSEGIMSEHSQYIELRKMIKWMKEVAPKRSLKNLNKMEEELFYSPSKVHRQILDEYHHSALEMAVNIGVYEGIVEETLAKERFFTPKRFEK